MAELKRPLRDVLRDATPDRATVDRLWDSTQDKLAPRRSRWRRGALIAMPTLVATALILAWTLQPPAPRAVRLVTGEALPSQVAATATAALVVGLDDGSRIELSVGAALEPRLNDRTETVLRLQRGRARFELTDRRQVPWSIEVGGVIVQTRSAAFAAWQSDSTVEIEVYRGEVLLRGERVSARLLKLAAGEHASVPERTDVPETTPSPVAPSPVAPSPVAPSPVAPPVAPGAEPALPRAPKVRLPAPPPVAAPLPAVPWRDLARERKYSEAYEQLSTPGVQAAAKSLTTIDDLLQLADVARLSGHPTEALAPLERASREFPTDPRAGVAAYTRARVLADELHRPGPAADAVADALRLGLPDALVEAAHLRLVEMRRDAGDRPGAEAAAAEYDRKFPTGKLRDKIHKALTR